jgi:signal transduction histidine kinase
METKIHLLHLEDSIHDSELIHSIIERGELEHEYFLADNEKDFLHILETTRIDLILSDYNLPSYNGTKALQVAREKFSHIPFIFVTGSIGEDAAINAMLNGASDYVLKHKLDSLVPKIKRALNEYAFENARIQNGLELLKKNQQIEAQNKRYIKINTKLVLKNKEKEKQAIELIKAKEHAEESDRLKSAFLANMSHEIRTPMNGILGFADLLREPGLSGEEQQEYIDIINKSGARMLNIINDIVDISKIEAGLMEVDIQEVNINEKIETIYTFFKPEVEKKGMHLLFHNRLQKSEVNIQTDPHKLYAILTNLVKNAIKFSDKGTIEFGYNLKMTRPNGSKKASSLETNQFYLEFFIKDQGIGIPKERCEAVFQRFVQADISDKRAHQGAGLGLSITKAYVEMLGGKIWLKSDKGKGSIFYFTLPYNYKPEETMVHQNLTHTRLGNKSKKLKTLIANEHELSERLITEAVRIFEK